MESMMNVRMKLVTQHVLLIEPVDRDDPEARGRAYVRGDDVDEVLKELAWHSYNDVVHGWMLSVQIRKETYRKYLR